MDHLQDNTRQDKPQKAARKKKTITSA